MLLTCPSPPMKRSNTIVSNSKNPISNKITYKYYYTLAISACVHVCAHVV